MSRFPGIQFFNGACSKCMETPSCILPYMHSGEHVPDSVDGREIIENRERRKACRLLHLFTGYFRDWCDLCQCPFDHPVHIPSAQSPVPEAPPPEMREGQVFTLVISGEERALIDSALQSHVEYMPGAYTDHLGAVKALALRLKSLSPTLPSPMQPASQESQEPGSLTVTLTPAMIERIRERFEFAWWKTIYRANLVALRGDLGLMDHVTLPPLALSADFLKDYEGKEPFVERSRLLGDKLDEVTRLIMPLAQWTSSGIPKVVPVRGWPILQLVDWYNANSNEPIPEAHSSEGKQAPMFEDQLDRIVDAAYKSIFKSSADAELAIDREEERHGTPLELRKEEFAPGCEPKAAPIQSCKYCGTTPALADFQGFSCAQSPSGTHVWKLAEAPAIGREPVVESIRRPDPKSSSEDYLRGMIEFTDATIQEATQDAKESYLAKTNTMAMLHQALALERIAVLLDRCTIRDSHDGTLIIQVAETQP